MADQETKMVLRTVYLPPELDEMLRVKAFRESVTKGELIRQALAQALEPRPEEQPKKQDKPAAPKRRTLKESAAR